MGRFKNASRTPEEIQLAKETIADSVNVVRGKNNTLDIKGMKKLKEMEWELGELVVEVMTDELALSDVIPLLADVRTGNFGDQHIFQEVSAAVRVTDRALGTKPGSQRIQFTEKELVTTMREVIIEVPLEQVATGRYDPAQIADIVAETIRRRKVAYFLTTLDAGIAAGADRTGKAGYTKRYTGLTEANLEKAIDGLLDEGDSPTLFGRWLALAPIRAFPGWATKGSEAALREFETRGMVGSYLGAPIINLQDRFSKTADDTHPIPYNRLYINSGRDGAMYMEKDVSFMNFSEVLPAESVWRLGVRYEDGMLVHDEFQFRIIEI